MCGNNYIYYDHGQSSKNLWIFYFPHEISSNKCVSTRGENALAMNFDESQNKFVIKLFLIRVSWDFGPGEVSKQ